MATYKNKQITYGSTYNAKLHARAGDELKKSIVKNNLQIKGLDKQRDSAFKSIDEKLLREVGILLSNDAKIKLNYFDLAKDNDEAESDTSLSNLSNQRRERAQSLAQVQAQGGGETDALKAQGVALRNWAANQQPSNRSYSDSLTGVNNSIVDSDVTTGTNITNAIEQADTNKRDAFNQHKESVGAVLTTNIDLYGKMSDYYRQTSDAMQTKTEKVQQSGKPKNTTTKQWQSSAGTKTSKRYDKEVDNSFLNMHKEEQKLADLNGLTYTAPLATKEQLGFQETPKLLQKQNTTDIDNAQLLTKQKRPEGATLRKW